MSLEVQDETQLRGGAHVAVNISDDMATLSSDHAYDVSCHLCGVWYKVYFLLG